MWGLIYCRSLSSLIQAYSFYTQEMIFAFFEWITCKCSVRCSKCTLWGYVTEHFLTRRNLSISFSKRTANCQFDVLQFEYPNCDRNVCTLWFKVYLDFFSLLRLYKLIKTRKSYSEERYQCVKVNWEDLFYLSWC